MNDIRGFDRAQAQYDAMEPPENDWGRCKSCGEDQEDHIDAIRLYWVDRLEKQERVLVCPDAYACLFEEHVYEEEAEPEDDPDRRRDERDNR